MSERTGERVGSVRRIGAGCDNVAYETDAGLVVRRCADPDPAARAAQVDREARLLAVVAAAVPLPVPAPVFVSAADGCLAYRKLAGVPLVDLPADRRADYAVPVAVALGGLLAAMHAVPAGRVAGLVDVDRTPPAQWLAEASGHRDEVADRIPHRHQREIDAFLAAPPPRLPPGGVFSHNDLGIEHVLVDPDRPAVTGVIDFTDAAVVDPACDFGLIYRDLGPAALDAALRGYAQAGGAPAAAGAPARMRERAVFYGRCSVFEDLAYGVRTGLRVYAGKSLAALDWLFPA